MEYIIKHVRREERPELPEEAIREAVVNALAHRDYRSTANVQIYLFTDRLEIVSPGGLPAGMDAGHPSFSAEVLRCLGRQDASWDGCMAYRHRA